MTNIKTFRQLSIDDTLYVVSPISWRLHEYKSYSIYNNNDDVFNIIVQDETCSKIGEIDFKLVGKDQTKRTIIVSGFEITLFVNKEEAIKSLEKIQTKEYLKIIRDIKDLIIEFTVEISDKQSVYNALSETFKELNESFVNLTQTIANDQTKEHKGE